MQENRLNKFRSIVSEVSSFMSYTLQFEFYFNEIKINQDFITSDTGCPNKQLVSVKKYQNVNCKTFCAVSFLYRSFSFQNSTPLGNRKINKHVLKSSRRKFLRNTAFLVGITHRHLHSKSKSSLNSLYTRVEPVYYFQESSERGEYVEINPVIEQTLEYIDSTVYKILSKILIQVYIDIFILLVMVFVCLFVTDNRQKG